MHSHIAAIGTATAPHRYAQDALLARLLAAYNFDIESPAQAQAIFQHALVDDRYLVCTLEELLTEKTFPERNHLFFDKGLPLAEQAILRCLAQTDAAPADIDNIIFVSTTGFVVPSLDAYLIERLGCPATTRRYPIFGWGCTGGLAGLRLASALAETHPRARTLLVNLELCSLAFQPNDRSVKALIGNAIFNDGATATLIEGKDIATQRTSPKIVGSRSFLFPDTKDLMGWEHIDSGLQVILSPTIPALANIHAAPFVAALLADCGKHGDDLQLFLFHPGGAKVLSALATALAIPPPRMAYSWRTLKRFGNMSSCSVFFVLQEALAHTPPAGSLGLMLAFGPGFSAEGIVLQW